MRDPNEWCCTLLGCRDATISNVKLVGLWRYNSDGIDVCNSEKVTVQDCFVRAFDDALVIKGLKFDKNSFHDRPVRDVRFRRCVVWCDWGRALKIGTEVCAPEVAGVVFEDCDVVRTTHVAMDIQLGDRNGIPPGLLIDRRICIPMNLQQADRAVVRDVRFEDIRVEIDDRNPSPVMQRTRDEKYADNSSGGYCPMLLTITIRRNNNFMGVDRGAVRGILFKDILVTGRQRPPSHFQGLDAGQPVEDVTIQNLRFDGRPVRDAREAGLTTGAHVKNVHFAGAGP